MAQFGLPQSVVTPAQMRTRKNFLQILHSFASSGKPLLDGGQVWEKQKQIVEQVWKGVAWSREGRRPSRVPRDLGEPEDGEPAWDNCRADLLEEGQSISSQYFPCCITFPLSQGVAANTRSNTTAGKRTSERAAHKDCLQETPMTHFAFLICFPACLCLVSVFVFNSVFVFVYDVAFVFIWMILWEQCTQNVLLKCSADSLQFPWRKMQLFHARKHDWQVHYAFLFHTLFFCHSNVLLIK